MTIEVSLDLLSAALMLAAALVPAYLATRLKKDLRILSISLALFILAHGIYHLVRMQGSETIADGFFEPLSVVFLIAFGLIFLGVSARKSKEPANI